MCSELLWVRYVYDPRSTRNCCLGVKPCGTEEGHPHNVVSRYVVLFVFVSFYDAFHVWGRREMHIGFGSETRRKEASCKT